MNDEPHVLNTGVTLFRKAARWTNADRLSRRYAYRGMRRARAEFYKRLWAQAAANIGAAYEDLGNEFYRVRLNGKSTLIWRGDVRLDDPVIYKAAGNKPLLYRFYEELGVAAPRHLTFKADEMKIAEDFLVGTGAPAVVKPASDTGGGQGVTMNVRSLSDLSQAVRHAAQESDDLLIEEQLTGYSHRLLFLDGELIDAVRRMPPELEGDGAATVKELVSRENQNRRKAAPVTALSPLTIDPEMRRTLSMQNLALGSRPAAGERIRVKSVANENAAPQNFRCLKDVHPSTSELARNLVTALGVRLAGVDVICHDLAAPLSDGAGKVCEVNTGPGLHHHYLTNAGDAPNPVAETVLRRLLKE